MWPTKMVIAPVAPICPFNHCRRNSRTSATQAIHRLHPHHLDLRIHLRRPLRSGQFTRPLRPLRSGQFILHRHQHHSGKFIHHRHQHHSDRPIHLQLHSSHRIHRLLRYRSHRRHHIHSTADHLRHQFTCHLQHHSIDQVRWRLYTSFHHFTQFNRLLLVPSGSYLPPASTPFPIYQQQYSPFPGYEYSRPTFSNIPNSPNYQQSNNNNNFNYQTPAPVFYSSTPQPFPSSSSLPPITSFAARSPSIDDYSRSSTTLAPPLIRDVPTSTISTILDEDASPIPPRNRYDPSDFISSTPRPFNGVTPLYQQPETVYITPKSFYNQRLPNSNAINQDLLPPYLNVNGLDDRRVDFQISGPRVRPLNAVNNYNNYQPNDYKK